MLELRKELDGTEKKLHKPVLPRMMEYIYKEN